ncbi:YbhB/YbcL family Raf kinase inhibitor-like protein [Candidatus Bathyarchaeota archaeon A05DMB-2]|jgi:Raf kinase inhibitor-like YbhB/YbcL family protein|nr:YbhB/YbcL family Raf kinase inhibitor-like protein [Candidatus Bathyarchaeota archaeon A05DMB-2]
MKELVVKSSAFENNQLIPVKYTCDGDNVNPPLTIEGATEETRSLVLIIDDPDAPMGTWDHWVVWNIPPTDKIEENSVPGIEGRNSARKHSYAGPCPPWGTHRYFFKVYALDAELELKPDADKNDVEKAMQGHILAKGEIVGRYRRSR